jgi:hypothetical protein
MKTSTKQITVNKKEWEEYKILLSYLMHLKDKMEGKFIKSDNFDELVNYLDS